MAAPVGASCLTTMEEEGAGDALSSTIGCPVAMKDALCLELLKGTGHFICPNQFPGTCLAGCLVQGPYIHLSQSR